MNAYIPSFQPGRVSVRLLASGGTSTWMPRAAMFCICTLVPVPGVSQRDLWTLGHANRFQLAFRGGDHRLEVPEVRRIDRDLGRDHNVVLIDDSLRAITLHPTARTLHVPRVGIGHVDLPHRFRGRLIRLRWTTHPIAFHTASDSLRPPRVIPFARRTLDRQVFLHPPLRLKQPRRPGSGDRLGLLAAALIELVASLTHPPAPRLLMTNHRGAIELDRVTRRFRGTIRVLNRAGRAFGQPALCLT